MRRFAVLAVMLLAPARAPAQLPSVVAHAEWRAAFDSVGVRGTFVVRPLGGREYHVFDSARARRRYLPASTFKVANTLIALEMKVARDDREPFPFTWPHSTVSEAWNRDHTLRTALKYSVVPVYQRIARRVGEAGYRSWLARLDYGNRDPRGGVDRFWLEGALRISAIEQVDFIARLAERRLPVSERSQLLVADMLVREANDCYVVRAKTGLVGISTRGPLGADERVGWYVGWVETDSAAVAFALNIDVVRPGDAAARVPLTRTLLARAGFIPRSGRC